MKKYKTILVALMFTFWGQLVAEDLKATSKSKLRNKSKESAIKISGDWIDHYETHSNPSINYRLMKPSVLKEKANAFFEIDSGLESPYMLLVADIQSDCRSPLSDQDAACEGLEKLKVCRSELPAVTHVDYSARVQTVDADRHKKYYKLLKMFEAQTGCPVLINTSFNVRGEPVVCTPEDAYHCFLGTHMDVLVVENFVLFKEEQPDADTHIRDEYLADFPLD